MRTILAVLIGIGSAFLWAAVSRSQPPQQVVKRERVTQPRRSTEFWKEGSVTHQAGLAIVAANDARPLLQAVSAIREEYGWAVDYEDPPFMSDSELVEYAAPAWRASHPGVRGSRIPSGRSFQAQYPESATIASPEGTEAVLRKVVTEYNKSGNPGKFVVRQEGEGRFAIVGSSVKNKAEQDEDQMPILDISISIPTELRSAYDTLKLIVNELSTKSGTKVALGMIPNNNLVNAKVAVGGDNVPARSLLLQTLNGTEAPLIWSLMYEANRPMFFLNIIVATRTLYDTYGRKTSMRIDFPVKRRVN